MKISFTKSLRLAGIIRKDQGIMTGYKAESFIEYLDDNTLIITLSNGEIRDRNYLKRLIQNKLNCSIYTANECRKALINYFISDTYLRSYNGCIIRYIISKIMNSNYWYYDQEELKQLGIIQ